MKKIALVLDLDDTLYNWKDSFVTSLDTQITYLAKNTRLTKKRIQESFKKVFIKHGVVEVIDAAYELDIWNEVNLDKKKIDDIKNHSTKIFLKTFENNLELFPTVLETLEWAKKNQILIFAFSNASAFWINFRLNELKINNLFEKIYVLEDEFDNEINPTFVTFPISKMKPNTFILDEIRRVYHLQKESIYYVGDSKDKDIQTANLAGVKSILAQYEKRIQKSYGLLSIVTPWKKTQKLTSYRIVPQYTIKRFSEIKLIIEL